MLPNIPLEWDDDIIRILSQVAPDDVEGAKVWWETYAPSVYASLVEALNAGDSRGIRDEQDIREILESQNLSLTQQALRRGGALFIFAGGRYYTMSARLVSRSGVVTATNKAIRGYTPTVNQLCERLRTGAITLRMWQTAMKNHIVQSHIASGLAAAGGADSITQQHISVIQEQIAFQLEKLAAMATAIMGGLKQDGRICRLMRMYLNSARGTYHMIDGIIVASHGYTEYRNILGAGEAHCTGGNSCPSVSDKGWSAVGSLPPIGTRKCLSNCLCTWQYRNPLTMQVW